MASAIYAGLGLIFFLNIITLIWLVIVQLKVSKLGKDLKNVRSLTEFLDGENAIISAWALRTQEELHPGSTA